MSRNSSMTTDMEHQKIGLEDDMTVNFQWISHKLMSILIFWGITPNSPIVRRDKTWATLETRRNGLGTKISGSLACGCQDVFGSRVWPLNIVQPCFFGWFFGGSTHWFYWKMLGYEHGNMSYIHEGIDIGSILQSPQRGKRSILKTQQFCTTIERSRESFRCPVKYPDIVRDLPKASHHHDNPWQYLHAFSGFFSWVCQASHTLIKGVGPEAPANLLDECWCHHDFPQTLSRLGETHQPRSARMPGHCQTICYMLFQALWPGIWEVRSSAKDGLHDKNLGGCQILSGKDERYEFRSRYYKKIQTTSNSNQFSFVRSTP